ncbi:MAG: GxxExxY protein [Candidatus Bipolaricaulota bacterium]|nr:GxxExxY protein [Candidatus Bipolaricaulota bacterium]
MEFDELPNRIIGRTLEVHRELGPRLLESTYEQCLSRVLRLKRMGFEVQHPLQCHEAQESNQSLCSLTPRGM